MINYGLAPYYKDMLMSSLKEAEFFTVCFDESFNRIANKQQMDV